MKNPFRSAVRLPLLAAVFVSIAAWANAAPSQQSYYPAADTWVSASQSSPQGGNATFLVQNSGSVKEAFLRIRVPVTSGTGTPTAVTLTLRQSAGVSGGGTVQIHGANNRKAGAADDWADSMLWADRPAFTGPLLDSEPIRTTAGIITFDVTDYISGPGDYTFRVSISGNTAQVSFNSVEATGTANDPVLTVTVDNDIASEYYRRLASEVQRRGTLFRDRYRASNTTAPDDIDNIGIIDVTKQPYGLKSSATDIYADANTVGLQRAINEARDGQLVVFIPAGTYFLSDKINAVQGEIPHPKTPPEGSYGTEYYNALRINTRDFPCILQGDRSGTRPVLKLKNNSPGFNSPGTPKEFIYFWSRLNSTGPEDNEDNSHYFQAIDHIDIDLNTTGNLGAVGLSMAAAQGCNISNVSITGTGFHAGLEGAPGPGGYIYGLSVDGGKYGGLFLDGHAPVVVNSRFINQTTGGKSLVYGDRGTMVLVGCEINGRGISLEPLNASDTPWLASLTVVDSRIQITADGSNPRIAIIGNRSVFLKNVYLLNGGVDPAVQLTDPVGAAVQTLMIKNGDGITGGAHSGWRLYEEWAAGVNIDQAIASATNNVKRVRRWVDGAMSSGTAGDIYILPGAIGAPPANFTQGTGNFHAWQSTFNGLAFPASDTGTVVNAKTTANGIAEGLADNAARLNAIIAAAAVSGKSVFIPRGEYIMEKPVDLATNTVLYGVSASHSVLRAKVGGSGATAFNNGAGGPLLRSTNDPAAAPKLADFRVLLPMSADANVYATQWRAGGNSQVRNVVFDRHATNTTNNNMTVPLVLISGNGGGRWYGLWNESSVSMGTGYRHLKVTGTKVVANNPLRFYMLNIEHGDDTPQAEFVDADEIRIYQFKAESGDSATKETVHFNNCSDFRMFGLAGASSPVGATPPVNANIRILGTCLNYLVAQLQSQAQASPNAENFRRLIDGATFVPGNEQAVLYKRGTTTSPAN